MAPIWLSYVVIGFFVLVAVSTLWIAFDPRIEFSVTFTETKITERDNY